MFKFIKDLFIKKNKEDSVNVEKLIVKDISEPVFSLCACIEKFPKKFKLKMHYSSDLSMRSYQTFDHYDYILIDNITNTHYCWRSTCLGNNYHSTKFINKSIFTKDEIDLITECFNKIRDMRIKNIQNWKNNKFNKKRERLTEIYKKALETN